ncbi:hypothetical protein V2I01_21115 [Micromonospora sp. BRA006-A]|nr:hypothetical protein [Micromonospora sp. BRA006-A]
MSGVYTCHRGSGFNLSVAADGQQRTVRLYAGLWMARAASTCASPAAR